MFGFKKYLYQNFHSFGNFLGLKCRRCQHLTSSHVAKENEVCVWKCEECKEDKEDDNICQIGDNDILEIISFVKTGIKTLIKYTDKIDNEA